MGQDRAVSQRPLLTTGWSLVFTTHGRYFFFDSQAKKASWEPPSDLLTTLTSLPEHILEAIFDPDVSEDTIEALLQSTEVVESEVEEDVEYEFDEDVYEETADEDIPVDSTHSRPPIDPAEIERGHQESVANFIALLKERNVDPFKPWDETAATLTGEAAFEAITSAKERADLFALVSPELADKVRSERQSRLEEARTAWQALLQSLTDIKRLPATWTEYSRQLKRTAPWYKLLDPKVMEKEYRARLQELRTLAITYNVKSNK